MLFTSSTINVRRALIKKHFPGVRSIPAENEETFNTTTRAYSSWFIVYRKKRASLAVRTRGKLVFPPPQSFIYENKLFVFRWWRAQAVEEVDGERGTRTSWNECWVNPHKPGEATVYGAMNMHYVHRYWHNHGEVLSELWKWASRIFLRKCHVESIANREMFDALGRVDVTGP